MTTRRDVVKLAGLAAAGLVLPGFAVRALAQDADKADKSVDMATLLQPGPLGDVWLGPADAKCTIVEYASMTCSHCARFHAETWPELRKRYIDTGKVRFTLREFPLDPLATAAFMLARCEGDKMYYPVTDLLFDQQKNWAYTQKPVDNLEQLLKQAGYTKEKFEACLKNEKIYAGINAVKQRGLDVFKVDSTPTFFINGARYSGEMTLDAMEKVIKPIIGA